MLADAAEEAQELFMHVVCFNWRYDALRNVGSHCVRVSSNPKNILRSMYDVQIERDHKGRKRLLKESVRGVYRRDCDSRMQMST